ncbi:MAG: YccF domain-containing protein [Propionibacterium sp.]|nr:YccF domain-containing protein [Propionibacterium sp.]
MRTVLNLIWLLFGGIWLALAYLIVGIISCLLIVTIPVGVAFMRMARYVVWPFGKEVVRKPDAGAFSTVINVIWFILIGWVLALVHIVAALGQAITIIGLTNAVVSLKMIPVSCFPFGKRIVDSRF